MQWASAVSRQGSLKTTTQGCVNDMQSEPGIQARDLAIGFVSINHSLQYAQMAAVLHKPLRTKQPIGHSTVGSTLLRSYTSFFSTLDPRFSGMDN